MKYKSEATRVNSIDIDHDIEYDEKEWLIQEKTMSTDGNKMKHVNNDRILNW